MNKNLEKNEELASFKDAVKFVVETKNTSVAFLQKNLGLNFATAGRFLDKMEEEKIISRIDKENPTRKVLITSEQFREMFNSD